MTSELEPDYGGVIGDTVAESTPWWPERRADNATKRPNVVVILLDDVGFAQLGCYGASIATPNIDALAGDGLRYTNFHATALCSPTRASLLTGRNHHSVGMGFLAAFDTGFPNYRGHVTRRAATIAEVLRDHDYGTYAVGKWHLVPPGELTAAGPFQHFPTQRGFDRFYGFLGGEEEQWAPELWSDQHLVDVPEGRDGGRYHLSEDLVDRAAGFVDDHLTARPDDPFLLYTAFGACHAPLQAPADYIERYRGAFDHGWDVERQRVLDRQIDLGVVPPDTELAPRNPGVEAWDDLDDDQRAVYARLQEVFAGFMAHTDAQIGRLIDHLGERGVLDETIVLLMSDNGASAEGGIDGTANEYRWFLRLDDSLADTAAVADELGAETTHAQYPIGWAQAGNTPMRYYKRYADGGGVRVPLIVRWPGHLDTEQPTRQQFHHVIDVLPTLLDVCGAAIPDTYRGLEQLPVHGTPMTYTFGDPTAPTTHSTQYFETAGYRAIVDGEWKAIARHQPGDDFAADRWELYRFTADVAETADLADDHPDVVARLQERWWSEARTYGVLPLDDRMQTRMAAQNPAGDSGSYVLYPGGRTLNLVAGPNFFDRRFRITADIGAWAPGHDGVLLAWGRRATGMSLFVLDGRLQFDLNLGGKHVVVATAEPLPTGATTLQLSLDGDDAGATATLLADDVALATGELAGLIPSGMGLLPTQCGYNAPSPVSPLYDVPFRYRGDLRRVVVELAPRHGDPTAADWAAALGEQ